MMDLRNFSLSTNSSQVLVNPTKGFRFLPRSCCMRFSSLPINNGRTNFNIVASYGGSVTSAAAAASGDDENSPSSQAQKLRKILGSPGIYQGPACFDALSAKLVERAGFEFCFTTGKPVSCRSLLISFFVLCYYYYFFFKF